MYMHEFTKRISQLGKVQFFIGLHGFRLQEAGEKSMKLVCMAGEEADQEMLRKEFKEARRFGEVRLGTSHLFYRYFIRIRYVSYGEITEAYLRQESGESGEFLLMENYLMTKMKNGSLHKLRMERETYVREVLSELEKYHSSVKIGFNRPSQSKQV